MEDLKTLKKGIKDQIKKIQILNIGKEELPLLQKYTDKIDKIIGNSAKDGHCARKFWKSRIKSMRLN